MGRLVLIPYVEGKRSPNGIEEQQRAEQKQVEVLKTASRALGAMVGLSESIGNICINMVPKTVKDINAGIVDMDDRVCKNYALLICIAEKVTTNKQTTNKIC